MEGSDSTTADDTTPDASVDLNSLTVPELKERASAAGVTGFSSMKQAELVAALGGEPEPDVSGHLVSVVYPHDAFDTGIAGVEVITTAGVDVPKSKLKQVKAAAESYGVNLEVK